MSGPVLKITRGLPGSGKTTFVHNYVREQLDRSNIKVTVTCRDDLRAAAGLSSLPTFYEPTITLQQQAIIRAGLKAGHEVIVADCNLRAKYVKEHAKIAEFFGAPVELIDFDTPVEECIRRDAARAEKGLHVVGEEVIRRFYEHYFPGGKFPPNPLTGRADRVKLVPYEPDDSLAPTFIFDIDGTVARMNGRSPYDYTKVLTDLPHEDVLELAWLLYSNGNKIVFLSGREASCYEDTVKWIEFNSPFYVGTNCFLFMRNAGDKRADFIVKYELFMKYIAPYFYVKATFDDRDQVVDLWRSIGLRCYQVNYGNF